MRYEAEIAALEAQRILYTRILIGILILLALAVIWALADRYGIEEIEEEDPRG